MRSFDDVEKEILAIMKKIDPGYKVEIVRVNISSSFMMRVRCKQCGKGPAYYYYVRKPDVWRTPSSQMTVSKIMREWINRMCGDWYLHSNPKYFHNLKEFSFVVEDRQFRPTLHRTRGLSIRDNVIELVGCNCGASVWAFSDKANKNRPEITNRKGRYKYPQKFEY